jgi:hypothetical protein
MPTNDLRSLVSDPLVVAFLKDVIVYGETLVIYAISDSEDLMDNPEIASIVKEWEEDKLTSEEADKKQPRNIAARIEKRGSPCWRLV